jgi:hypothetical protein
VTALANIGKASLSVTGTTVADNIVYDGTPDVSLSGGVLSGVLSGDVGKVTMNQTGNFVTYNVGTGIQVIASNTLGGGASGDASANYVIAQQPVIHALANISAAPLSITGVTNAVNKTYDGTTAATFFGGNLSGVVVADMANVSLNQIGSFASPNVGNNIPVFAAMTLSGSAAVNYFITQPSGVFNARISESTTQNNTQNNAPDNSSNLDSNNASASVNNVLIATSPTNVRAVSVANINSPNFVQVVGLVSEISSVNNLQTNPLVITSLPNTSEQAGKFMFEMLSLDGKPNNSILTIAMDMSAAEFASKSVQLGTAFDVQPMPKKSYMLTQQKLNSITPYEPILTDKRALQDALEKKYFITKINMKYSSVVQPVGNGLKAMNMLSSNKYLLSHQESYQADVLID